MIVFNFKGSCFIFYGLYSLTAVFVPTKLTAQLATLANNSPKSYLYSCNSLNLYPKMKLTNNFFTLLYKT